MAGRVTNIAQKFKLTFNILCVFYVSELDKALLKENG